MHDIGLVDPYDKLSGSFELNGARTSHEFLLNHQFEKTPGKYRARSYSATRRRR